MVPSAAAAAAATTRSGATAAPAAPLRFMLSIVFLLKLILKSFSSFQPLHHSALLMRLALCCALYSCGGDDAFVCPGGARGERCASAAGHCMDTLIRRPPDALCPTPGQQTINSPNLVPVALHPIFPHSFARWLVENRGNLRKSPCARPVAAPQVCEKCNSLGVAIEGRRKVLQEHTVSCVVHPL